MIKKLIDLIYQTQGKFTDELALKDSEFSPWKLPERLLPDTTLPSICGYCSTGCSLDVHIKDKKAVNITPTHPYPVNLGEACPKGWEALSALCSSDRATVPLLRNPQGKMEGVTWDKAAQTFTDSFKQIQAKYGPESIAFLSTGQIPCEEMALLGAVAKFGMGIIHGDGNTRQCMATAATAYKQSFGFDAPPFTYKDFEESDVLVFIGANPCIAHPIMWQRVLMNKNNPKIIVIDPRKTETAMAATHHYSLTPKSDLAFLYSLAHILIKHNYIDKTFIKQHTTAFEDFKRHVEPFSPEPVSRVTGLQIQQIQDCAKMIGKGKRVSFWWTMGVNQSHEAVRTAQAIINLALMTGNIGRPGTGANSITGQCNAMGSRLYSNTTNLLGGYDFLNSKHRQKISKILNIDELSIPAQNSLAYDQIIEGIAQNKIKGLWVIATNPAHSWINRGALDQYLKNLDFLVVQDMYTTTETTQAADLLLPAAGWGEKTGTFINSERRIGLIQKASQPPGEALADFDIIKRLAEAWGCAHLFKEWSSPEAVFQIIKRISEKTPCDITGIKDYKMVQTSGGVQWPLKAGEALVDNERRLFENSEFFHKDKKAKFLFEDIQPKPESTSNNYPFVLLTGRGTSAQWHTQTRTGKSKVLQKLYPQHIYVEMNPDDAGALNILPAQWIHVSTLRATVKAVAVITPTIKPGQLFMPMHYAETNLLTFPAVDPYSRQPSYKFCAASLSLAYPS